MTGRRALAGEADEPLESAAGTADPHEAAGADAAVEVGAECPLHERRVLPRPGREVLAIDDLLALSEDDYRLRFYGTSLARAR
jgi:hypothetical protein